MNPMVPPMEIQGPAMMPPMNPTPWRSSEVQMWMDEEARASGIDPDYLENMETKVAHMCHEMNTPMPQQCWGNECMPLDEYLSLLEETAARFKVEALLHRYHQ